MSSKKEPCKLQAAPMLLSVTANHLHSSSLLRYGSEQDPPLPSNAGKVMTEAKAV